MNSRIITCNKKAIPNATAILAIFSPHHGPAQRRPFQPRTMAVTGKARRRLSATYFGIAPAQTKPRVTMYMIADTKAQAAAGLRAANCGVAYDNSGPRVVSECSEPRSADDPLPAWVSDIWQHHTLCDGASTAPFALAWRDWMCALCLASATKAALVGTARRADRVRLTAAVSAKPPHQRGACSICGVGVIRITAWTSHCRK